MQYNSPKSNSFQSGENDGDRDVKLHTNVRHKYWKG